MTEILIGLFVNETRFSILFVIVRLISIVPKYSSSLSGNLIIKRSCIHNTVKLKLRETLCKTFSNIYLFKINSSTIHFRLV